MLPHLDVSSYYKMYLVLIYRHAVFFLGLLVGQKLLHNYGDLGSLESIKKEGIGNRIINLNHNNSNHGFHFTTTPVLHPVLH